MTRNYKVTIENNENWNYKETQWRKKAWRILQSDKLNAG